MNSFEKRRILVTGGAGFLGSHLCEKLINKGNEVICLDNYYTGSKNNVAHLMNNENFEQSSLDKSLLSGNKDFLSDGIQLTVDIIGDEIVNIKLPKSIMVEVKTADAVVKGQTASSSFKNAITTNDIKILVPPHIKEGDKIIINTDNYEYLEKAKK